MTETLTPKPGGAVKINWVKGLFEMPGRRLVDRYDASGCLSDRGQFWASVCPTLIQVPWLLGEPKPELEMVWHWWTSAASAGERSDTKHGVEDDADTALYRAEISVHEYVYGDLAWWTQSTGAAL